mmetsp:Transcript_12128/g.29564  ORF Transcript_12128/g.29564 Transcript_12128/m.29564 type:complete len:248 (+) Transcript_12128:296-1039(+)
MTASSACNTLLVHASRPMTVASRELARLAQRLQVLGRQLLLCPLALLAAAVVQRAHVLLLLVRRHLLDRHPLLLAGLVVLELHALQLARLRYVLARLGAVQPVDHRLQLVRRQRLVVHGGARAHVRHAARRPLRHVLVHVRVGHLVQRRAQLLAGDDAPLGRAERALQPRLVRLDLGGRRRVRGRPQAVHALAAPLASGAVCVHWLWLLGALLRLDGGRALIIVAAVAAAAPGRALGRGGGLGRASR